MKNLYALFGLSVSNVMFRESRLVYGTPEGPKGPSQSAEVPKQQMMPLAKSLIKDILSGANGMHEFTTAKGNPAKQKKMIERWLKSTKLTTKTKNNFMGTALVTEYYLGSKKVNPSKVTSEVYAFLRVRKNRTAIMAAIKREKAAAASKAAPKSTVSAAPAAKFREVNFSGSSQREADRRARTAESFYQGIVSKRLASAMIHDAEDAKSIQTTLNRTLNPYGVNVEVSLSGSKVSFKIQFNGPKAWPKISSASRRRKAKRDIVRKLG